MRTAYKVLAWLVALEVVIQAAAMVYAVAGLGAWIDQGGVLDKGAFDSGKTLFPEMVGMMIHGMNGMMIIPVLALALMVVSFFAKVPGGVKWAGFVLLAVVVQVSLGLLGHEVSVLGMFHGINALILFSVAVMAGVRAHRSERVAATTTTAGSPELV